jgi:pseudaminic acid cytidylyltransferase
MRIAIVPARGGSKRIPDKNIVDFLGMPLIGHSLRAARESGLFDCIHVSTDSARIAEVAASLGHPVDFMRDPALADDHTPLLPVLRWTFEQYAARGQRFDSACLLMPTAPLIEADDLRQANAVFEQHARRHTVMAVARFPVPIEWAFRMPDGAFLVPCQPGMGNVRSQDLAPAYYDAGTFIFLPEAEVLAGRIDDAHLLAYPLPRHKAIDIDDPEDLELAKIIYRGLHADISRTATP